MSVSEEKIITESIKFAKEKMTRLHYSHGWDHVERVENCARSIAETEPKADPFIVRTAAILHDIARIDEAESNGKTCHAQMGSEMAYSFLAGIGLDEKRSVHIRRCILTHRFRNSLQPESIEAQILYDADKLDSIGAIGIGRAFLFSGEVGARLHNPDIDINMTEAYSKEDTAYREYMVKLRFIKDRMLTAEGKRIAEARNRYMDNFFNRLKDEVKGLL